MENIPASMPQPITASASKGRSARSDPPKPPHPGRLIVFEGLDGVGKTTQIELLADKLRERGLPVVITTWNSSRLISKAIKRAKKAKLLTPYLYSTLHAADFMYRLENVILPAIRDGAIVIADRYAYTALARDLARNVDRRWVESLYALAPKPDLAFYCSASVEETLLRIIDRNGGGPPSYYESGMDVTPHGDPEASFREFQARVASEYERITKDFGLIEIDASASIADVHEYVVSIVEQRLRGWNAGESSVPHAGSSDSGRIGRGGLKGSARSHAAPSRHLFPGRLVVIESADKEAASRQANLLYNELLTLGYDVRLAPAGKSWVGIGIARKALKKGVLSPQARVILSAAEIALYYEQEIIPALTAGSVIIMDGYVAGLYTDAVAKGIQPGWFDAMSQIFHIKPDRTILIDVPLRDVMRQRPKAPAAASVHDFIHESSGDVMIQSRIIDIYKELAESDCWGRVTPAAAEKDLQRAILADVGQTILPALRHEFPNNALGEIFGLFSRYDRDFDHPRKVAALALSLFDQTVHLHGYGDWDRMILFCAAMLHDIGHALSETRHEEFTFEAIIRHHFDLISDYERELIANIAYLHRQQLSKLNFRHLGLLKEPDQLRVKRLAALLRIADALDESGRRAVHEVRCYEENGIVYLDLHAVAKALPERTAAERKADLFENVYRKTIEVVRNRREKLARRGRRLEAEPIEPRNL